MSEDESDLVGEGNHVSHDTTCNNSVISDLSANENSKTNSNPKKRKVIELEKKTMIHLEAKLLRLLKKLKL